MRNKAAVREADLALERTVVRASVSGWVTNLTADVGDFVTSGPTVMGLVDADSFRVEAYFMETKLPRVREGAAAEIRLMAGGAVLPGEVQGIARGIYRPNTQPDDVLESPQPSFQWIRLAQRIPVRIDITERPDGLSLVAGQTATVMVEDREEEDGPLARIGHRLTTWLAQLQ